MCGRHLEVRPVHLAETQILSKCYAWLLVKINTTFFEVDGRENTRLHQDDFFSSIGKRNGFVTHFTIYIHLAFG